MEEEFRSNEGLAKMMFIVWWAKGEHHRRWISLRQEKEKIASGELSVAYCKVEWID